MLSTASWLLAAALLCSCATPYQPYRPLRGGYSEQVISDGVYRLTFAGDGSTTRESVQTYWLYRATELALSDGYDGFEILTPLQLGSADPPPLMRPAGLVFVPIYTGPPRPVYTFEANIRLLNAPVDAAPPLRFDARALQDALRPYVQAPNKCSEGNICSHRKDYLRPPSKAETHETRPREGDSV